MFSRLPRDKIKLDRAFVAEFRTVAPSQKVPRAPATLAKDLGIVWQYTSRRAALNHVLQRDVRKERCGNDAVSLRSDTVDGSRTHHGQPSGRVSNHGKERGVQMLSGGGGIFNECMKPDFFTARTTVAACIKNDGVESFHGSRAKGL